jgi:integrase
VSNSTPKSRTRKPRSERPKKPYAAFPLTPHASGAWQKKIRGKVHYFGRWATRRNGKLERFPGDGWKEALAEYKLQADNLHAGRTSHPKIDNELILEQLCNEFLTAKQNRVVSRELSQRSFADYRQIAQMVCDYFGKDRLVCDLGPNDFASLRVSIAKRVGPVRLGNEITRIKSIFKYAMENQLVENSVVYGTEFAKPRKEVMQKYRAGRDKKLFSTSEIKQLAKEASPMVAAATFLGINCGLGNTDISSLDQRHLDLDAGWLDYPRSKNGNPRRVPLWPVTVKHLRTAIADRPTPKDESDKHAVLLASNGERLVRLSATSRTDGVSVRFGRLLRKLDINGRKGLGFYSLRHTFATIGLQTGDRDAVKALMGHSYGDVLALYDQAGPSDERLKAVTDHILEWLGPIDKEEGGEL